MDDEPKARAVMVEGLLQRPPRVSAVGADRVQERFDYYCIGVDRVSRVNEPVGPCRRQRLGVRPNCREANDNEEDEGQKPHDGQGSPHIVLRAFSSSGIRNSSGARRESSDDEDEENLSCYCTSDCRLGNTVIGGLTEQIDDMAISTV